VLASDATFERLLRDGLTYQRALRAGRYHEATRIAQSAWRSTPANIVVTGPPVPFADGIKAAMSVGDRRQAVAWAESVGARLEAWNPQLRGGPHIMRTFVITEMGPADEARRALTRLDAMQDSLPVPMRETLDYARALTLQREGRPQEALKLLPNAAWIGPSLLWTSYRRLLRASLEMDLKQPASALATLDTLIRSPMIEADEVPRAHFNRGRALEALGRNEEARRAYEEFLRLWKDADPDQPKLQQARDAVRRLSAPKARV
jgi:tetratricopeptide (TPR) repeat protein